MCVFIFLVKVKAEWEGKVRRRGSAVTVFRPRTRLHPDRTPPAPIGAGQAHAPRPRDAVSGFLLTLLGACVPEKPLC